MFGGRGLSYIFACVCVDACVYVGGCMLHMYS